MHLTRVAKAVRVLLAPMTLLRSTRTSTRARHRHLTLARELASAMVTDAQSSRDIASFYPRVFPAKILDWHDGDTCHADIDTGFSIFPAYTLDGHPVNSCRIRDINAPELRTTNGPASRDFANTLAPPGTILALILHSYNPWDTYGGRSDVSLTLPNGDNFSDLMVKAGMATAVVWK